ESKVDWKPFKTFIGLGWYCKPVGADASRYRCSKSRTPDLERLAGRRVRSRAVGITSPSQARGPVKKHYRTSVLWRWPRRTPLLNFGNLAVTRPLPCEDC